MMAQQFKAHVAIAEDLGSVLILPWWLTSGFKATLVFITCSRTARRRNKG